MTAVVGTAALALLTQVDSGSSYGDFVAPLAVHDLGQPLVLGRISIQVPPQAGRRTVLARENREATSLGEGSGLQSEAEAAEVLVWEMHATVAA